MLLMRRAKSQTEEVPFGAEVKRLRRQAGLTQEQLAERIGISREAVGDIERGETKQPSDDVLDALGAHIHLSRERAFELMGKIPGVNPGEIERIVRRAAQETDPATLLGLWRSLSPEDRTALRRLVAADLVGDSEQ